MVRSNNTYLSTVVHLRWYTAEGVREDDKMAIVHPETEHPSSLGMFPSLYHSRTAKRE
jgi:hypothetical protein